MTMMATATDVLEAVRAIPDPEIPVITIEGLGILRECRLDEAAGVVHVVITPTYSGCPAMRAIEDQIARVCRVRRSRCCRAFSRGCRSCLGVAAHRYSTSSGTV